MEEKNLEEVTQEKTEAAEEVQETVETAEETLEETAAEAEETAEETKEEAAAEAEETAEETAEEAAAESEETAEEAKEEAAAEAEETVEETAEEAAAESEETSEETAEETAETDTEEAAEEDVQEAAAEPEEETFEEEGREKKGSSVKEPPIIKKKKKLDKTNIIVIVVAAVIVIACLVFVGFKVGWFKIKQKGEIKVDDYAAIEVVASEVEVSDEMIEQYITNILQSRSESRQVTEGTVAEGDQINIDFVGKLDETGEEFDGGSAQGQMLTVGSGTMIEGFESSLVGAPIGTTKTINVVFPADYAKTDLAGKPATFDVTINYRSETVVPELTDEFVHEYSHNYLEKELNTVEDLEKYVHDYLYDYYLHSAMFEDLQTKATVEAYDEEKEAMLIQYSLDSLDYYAAMYGQSVDDYAKMYGFESAQAYAEDEAHYYLDTIMLIDQIIKDQGITWTDDDFNQSIALYMARNGYSDRYTVEEFLEQSGETWRYLYENLEFKFNLAMEALEKNVSFVESKEVPEESGAATEAETTTAAK